MAVQTITISNLSKQVIKVLYGLGTAEGNTSNFPYTEAGEFAIAPGSTASIEASRVDLGQLDSFKRKGLVAYTVY